MGEFNLNPIPHNPIAKVTNDRNPKREQKKEEDNSFTSIEQDQVDEQKKFETEISTDSFSVGEEPPKAGYTVDWVKMNNLKNSKNEP